MTRCSGSAASQWAVAARTIAKNGGVDGGGHDRMLSGQVIWCSTCGSYADLRVGGLTEACTGKDTSPWKGGGKRGQLALLRKNIHPRNGKLLPPPIPETMLAIDAAATATPAEHQAAKQQASRYNAKDKANARAAAADPKAALTE